MTKRKSRNRDEVQGWYDDGFALAEAVRRVRGAPDTARGEHLAQHNGQGGWGGRKLTKEEAEASARSSEASRVRTARARAADHQTLAEMKKQRIANKEPVNERARCGGLGLVLGVGSTLGAPKYVMNGKPAMSGPYYKLENPREGNLTTSWGTSQQADRLADWQKQDRARCHPEQVTQGLAIDESTQLQFYGKLERAAGRHVLEIEVPQNTFYRPLPYGWEAGMATVCSEPLVTGWCYCLERVALFYPAECKLPWCCRATAVPNQGWLAAMAGEERFYYSSN